MYNLVESCDYGETNDRIIRDVLIIGCNSDKAKDKIVQHGEKIKLQEVIEILQMEDSTRKTLTEMNSTMQKINYVSYDTNARNLSPKYMKKSAKLRMPSLMDVVLLAITR